MKFLMFGNAQCTRCRLLKPKYMAYGEEYVDTDENPEMAGKYGVRSIPTIISIDKEGNAVNRLIAPFTPLDMDAFINKERSSNED